MTGWAKITGTILFAFSNILTPEAQLPQRDSATATHVFLGSLTDRALHCCTTTPWAIKKRATFIFTITLANVDRFQ